MKNWPKIQYNQVQFGINASLEINEKACDCSLFTGCRYVRGGGFSRLCPGARGRTPAPLPRGYTLPTPQPGI